MKTKIISLIAFLALPLARGQGTFQYDQQATNATPPDTFDNIQPDPSGQSFVPSLSGVGFVQIYLGDPISGPGATLNMNIWSGSLTNGTLLGTSSSITVPGGFSGYGEETFTFSTPITLTPGTTYYFQPVIESGDSFQVGTLAGNAYTKGNAFFQGTAYNENFWFREGIIVPEPTSACFILLGAGALAFIRRKKLFTSFYERRNPTGR